MRIIIINGPNLNLLGKREKFVYGSRTFESYLKQLRKEFIEMKIDYFQSNVEGEIIDAIQKAGFIYDGIILNAGGYTHTSVSIGDAVKAVTAPVVEVHITNIFSREEYRHRSFISAGAQGCIIGFGLESYRLALISFLEKDKQ